jgi:hypothetical protein
VGKIRYATDLSDINLAEVDTDWAEMVNHKGGGAPAQESDYYIQGDYCVSQNTSVATGTQAGIQYDYGANVSPFRPQWVFLMWQIILAGNATTPFRQGGLRFYTGHAAGDWNGWKVGGEDFGRNPYGGWQNVAVDPTFTADYTEGTPNAGEYRYFASLMNLKAAISKGNPHGVDAIRYGRAAALVSGGDVGNGYATFDGLATSADNPLNRWGLFQKQAGGYLYKGLLSIGQGHDVNSDNSSAAMFDANRVITIDNTPRTYRTFNKIEIRNTGTFVYWDNIQIAPVSAAGSLSRGVFEVVDNPTGKSYGLYGFNTESCVFTDMFEWTFLENCFLNNTTWRRTGTVYQNSATFDNCTFDESPSAVALEVNNIERITNCDFVSQGTGHGMELTDAHIQGGEYDLDTCTFTGYASVSGGTGNEAIYNNSGNLITIYVLGGVDSPSIKNGAGANTILIQATTYTLTGVVSGSEIQIVPQDWADDGEVTADENLYHLENTTVDDGSGQGTTQATYTYNYTADIPIYVYVHKLGYEWTRIRDTLTNVNKTTPVSQKIDRVYSNP